MRAPRLRIVALGTWAAGASLVAEYDPATDTIAVDARAVARVRAVAGPGAARRLVACAVAHERYHRAFPAATEAEADAFARRVTGDDPRTFESLLRA